jgi:hypothetical protein
VDTVRKTRGSICEELLILESLAVGGDIEAVDGRRLGLVVLTRECLEAGVRDVDVLEVGAGVC